MALWQYDIIVIPEEEVSSLSTVLKKDADGTSTIDDATLWRKRGMSVKEYEALVALLPLGKTWHKDLTVYGDLESNCIKIFTEGDFVASATLRIDFRTNYRHILDAITTFCTGHKLAMISGQYEALPRDVDAASSIIQNSEQVKKYEQLARASNG